MFALIAALLVADPCSFGVPMRPAGSIVLEVTLEGGDAEKLPSIGANVINRLTVPARIDVVRRGGRASGASRCAARRTCACGWSRSKAAGWM